MKPADPPSNDRAQVQSSCSSKRISVRPLTTVQLNTLMLRIRWDAVQETDELSNLLILDVPPVIAVIVGREDKRMVAVRFHEQRRRRHVVIIGSVGSRELKTADVAERQTSEWPDILLRQ